jgi:molybdopterin synthase sulfur carrier subunit
VSETKIITVRYWAAARAAAGTAEDVLDVAGPLTLAEVRREAIARHPDAGFAAVLDACSVLVGEHPAGTRAPEDVVVAVGLTVEFLPPFAGG